MESLGYGERLQTAVDYIEENLPMDLSPSEVSRSANASPYRFHRLFRAFVGESLMEYFRHRRLSRYTGRPTSSERDDKRKKER
jgi:AraC-like DNA-binding protein